MKQDGSILTGVIYTLAALIVIFIAVDFLSNRPTGIPTTAFDRDPVVPKTPDNETSSSSEPIYQDQGDARVDRETDRFLQESQNLAEPGSSSRPETNTVPSQLKPTGWLRRLSFVCRSQALYLRLRDAMQATDVDSVESLLKQGCYEIGSTAEADILIWDEGANLAKIRAHEGGNVVTLWTHMSNIDRN